MKCILFAMALLAWAAQAQAAVRVNDDAGRTVTLPSPARRVISLAPSVTELLYEAGGGARLVGTVEYADYPPAARHVPRVGSNQRLDLERVASLRPDLILVWFHGNATREVQQLVALGLPMFYVEPHRIEDIPGALERIGQLVGTEPVAQAAARRFRERHAALQSQSQGRTPIRVFYQIAAEPLLTINDQQIIADVIRLCGGRNVFGEEPLLVPQLSTESVVAANPDVIIAANLGANGGQHDGILRKPNHPGFALWRRFSAMKAVRTGQLWLIPGDPISRHGPRILDGAQGICAVLDEARKAK